MFKYIVILLTLLSISCRVEESTCTVELLWKVRQEAYKTGYTEGKEDSKVVTIYLCHDWIPVAGYKAWRQCNTDEVIYKERTH